MKGSDCMNDTIKNIIERRSVRKYKDEMIPNDLLDKILEAGTYAPSGMGKQSPIIIAVTNKELRDKLSNINAKIMGKNFDPFYGAPVVIVVLALKDISTYIYDGSVVMENMMIAATSLGLGSCWIHRAKEMFETDEGKKILRDLGIDGEYEGIGNMILGYPDCEKLVPNIRKDNYIYKVD